jgi:uncharacterized membrane protein
VPRVLLPHLRFLVTLGALSWAALVVASPWLAAGGGAGGLRVSAAAYLVGSVICHQQSVRSFHLAGAQLPVCARCTGLYAGGACGLIAGLALGLARRRDPLAVLASRAGWRTVLAAASLPTALAVAAEWLGYWPASNAWRAGLAVPVAWAFGAFLAESLSFRGRL